MKKNILLLPMLLLVSCTQQEPFGEFNSIPTPIEQAAISDEVTTSDLARLANSFMNKHIREYEDFPYPTYYFYMNWGWNGYSNGFFADSYLCVPGYPVATNRTNIYDITY